MDAFKKVMENLEWLLCSTDDKNGKTITVHGVHMAALVELSKMKTPEEIQRAMELFVDAVLEESRYVHEYECYKLVRAIYRDLVSKGATFPVDKLFEFDLDGTVEDCIQNMPSRVALLFASGNDLNWMRGVEAVYWEEVMDETPTKELLMRCLKHYVDNMSNMLLW
jgi:hypothetical protein